jgi:hypothetical protein
MAEQTVDDLRRSIVLPKDCDPVLVAAAMKPAMSSWVALRRRGTFSPGSRVLVLGATGTAGRMAVQVARRLGASHIVGAGRDREPLAERIELGADATVGLSGAPAEVVQRLGQAAGEVDVVLDYLWGPPTADAMVAVVANRIDPGHPLTWIEVGSVAGPPLRSLPRRYALRACRSSAADRVRFRRSTSWPNSPSSSPRSRAGPFGWTRAPSPSPTSKPPGST